MTTKKNAVKMQILNMLINPKYSVDGGEALDMTDARWLMNNHQEFSTDELGEMIGKGAVVPFRTLCQAIGL